MSAAENDPIIELRSQLADFGVALEDLRKATTEREKREATADVKDAEADVAEAAKAAGLKPEVYRRAMNEARKAQFREENADVIRELVKEEIDSILDAAKDEEAETDESVADLSTKAVKKPRKPKTDAVEDTTMEEPPAPDAEPHMPHWSERAVSEMIR